MRRRIAAVLAALAAVSLVSLPGRADDAARSGPEQGSRPIPSYQIRGAPPPGDRLAAGRDGQQLFRNRCGSCHLAGGMGTNVLTARFKQAGDTHEPALLAERTDLQTDYVKSTVRNGKVAMPRLSRVEVTDPELDAIAAYLSGPKPP
jgi:mono/diheme cytochrome c family protein